MVDMKALAAYHTSKEAQAQVRRRRRSEWRLKAYGILAISLAGFALVALLWTIGSNAVRAIYAYSATVDLTFAPGDFDPETAIDPAEKALIDLGYMSRESAVRKGFRKQSRIAVEQGFLAQLGGVPDKLQNEAKSLLSGGNVDVIEARAREGAYQGGQSVESYAALLSDDAQLFFKGAYGDLDRVAGKGVLSPVGTTGEIELLDSANDFHAALALVKQDLLVQAARIRREAARQQNGVDVVTAQLEAAEGLSEDQRRDLENAISRYTAERDRLIAEAENLEGRAQRAGGPEALNVQQPSFIVLINGGAVKLTEIDNERAKGVVVRELSSDSSAEPGSWEILTIERPEASRKLSDNQIVWLTHLEDTGAVQAAPNFDFITKGDSREAELAGVWGGLVGTFWTMLVTMLLTFPVGVMAAIYLEEFAPKNWFTDFIEVNINNLAAIPSIVFGLFGLLLLLSGFKIPIFGYEVTLGGWFKEYRSAAFIGGVVLALMTLPTIIIASRASIRAVPPSIREAALGVGASKVQSVFHHVLPLAMPGIMTGAIIGMAQALGETAPLLMIGMVGFFANVAGGVADSTTVLPALVYFWSDYPEALFELKTSLAIVVLLVFLVVMNALAVLLRRRFERRW